MPWALAEFVGLARASCLVWIPRNPRIDRQDHHCGSERARSPFGRVRSLHENASSKRWRKPTGSEGRTARQLASA